LLAIHDRRLTATIRQGPLAIARTAIDVALGIIQGDPISPRTAVPVELVTAENAVEIALETLRFMPALIEDLTENHEQQRLNALALTAAKEKLEERVLERTKELDARNRKLRVVLDHVGEALFTVDLDGRLSAERSAVFDEWFPDTPAGAHVASVLQQMSPEAARWMEVAWEQLRDGWLPLDVALDQLPRKLVRQGRHFEIGYRPIHGAAGLEQILVMISDVTESVGLAQSEADQRELLAIFQQVVSHRDQFFEFFAECERLVRAAVIHPPPDRATLMRAIHTLKGICAMRGVASIVSICHALEKRLSQSDEEIDAQDRAGLTQAWSSFAERVRKLTDTTAPDRIELSRADLRAMSEAIEAGRGQADLLRMLRRLDLEPAADRLDRLANDARALAARLGKADLVVEIAADDVRFDRHRWAPFWSAFVHLLRNAIDHGIESLEERLASGKPKGGRLTLTVRRFDGEVVIEVSDDGRGVDWEGVRRKARSVGHDADTEAELLRVLLRGGISTKATATEISGRGAGLGACDRACAAIGGRLSLSTLPGRGTTIRLHFPAGQDGDPSPSY
jgi:two-component system chemotaxis sensor kinase CheA